MTETSRKGWVMVEKVTGAPLEHSFDETSDGAELLGAIALTRKDLLRRYKPVKATMTITLEDE